MIKANELRIGNWLQKTTAQGKIHYFQVTIPYLEVLQDEPNTFDPIPLNPEIIESAGFAKQNWGLSDFYEPPIHLQKEDDGYYMRRGAIYINKYGYQFLHQLQNLYQALTNSELQIEMPEQLPTG
jgi:hypothetical protein